jgi:2',3'-cyclic-nucleotide 2'-phosphodiesterase (5'-nucleotidase family)
MNFNVGKVKVTKADANAHTVYVHRFKYNTKTKKSSFSSELVYLNEKVAEDPEVKLVVDKWLKKVNTILDNGGYNAYEVIYKTNKELDGLELSIRNRPTELGYLSAEAMLAQEKTADFALLNSGAIRLDDKINGEVMQYDILRTFPFGGGITLMELNGKMVKELLAIGLEKNKGLGGFLQTSRNISAKDGNYLINGKAIEEGKTYKVLMTIYLAEGKESNLEFLSKFHSPDYDKAHKTFASGVKNDIVDLVIAYLKTLKN